MDENYEMGQPLTDEQHFQELRQRINEKAESLIKYGTTEGRKSRWIAIAVWVVLIAIIVAVEVYSYMKNDFGEFNLSIVAFIAAAFVTDRIIVLIMRHYLTRMKNAATAPQHFRALKRLIRTHKLRNWVPLAVALTCGYFLQYRTGHWTHDYFFGYAMVIGAILGSAMRNWFLDDDFRFDVEELADLINQDNAA